VSRTLYKGLFYRAGPESPCSPELGKPGTRPQDLDAHYTVLPRTPWPQAVAQQVPANAAKY
jgi:hypothetical protein